MVFTDPPYGVAIGDKLAFYGANKATYGHVMIENGVGDNAVFGVSGITATKLNSTGTELIGYQKNLVNDTAIRFLAGIDSLYYSGIGFDVERDGTIHSSRVDEDVAEACGY